MPKKIIAVDIDDVLANQNDAMRLFVNERYGLAHSPEDFAIEGEYFGYWGSVWGVDRDEEERRIQAYLDAGTMERLELLPHAAEAMKELGRHYELAVVTARQDIYEKTTRAWLEQHFPKIFKNIHFVPIYHGEKHMTKAEVCLQIGASYLIDDNPDHCKLAAEAGIEALLFGNFGWNRADTLPPHVTRTPTWLDVQEYFHEKH